MRLRLWKKVLLSKNKREYCVYVIGLKPSFAKTKSAKKQNPNFVPGPNKRCYYVGYSSDTPEIRYEKHITGYVNKKGHNTSSPKVYNYGYKRNGLRPRQYKRYNPISTEDEAKKIEIELAEKLRKKGHCVYQA